MTLKLVRLLRIIGIRRCMSTNSINKRNMICCCFLSKSICSMSLDMHERKMFEKTNYAIFHFNGRNVCFLIPIRHATSQGCKKPISSAHFEFIFHFPLQKPLLVMPVWLRTTFGICHHFRRNAFCCHASFSGCSVPHNPHSEICSGIRLRGQTNSLLSVLALLAAIMWK